MSNIFDYPTREEFIASHDARNTRNIIAQALKNLDKFYKSINVVSESALIEEMRNMEVAKRVMLFRRYLQYVETIPVYNHHGGIKQDGYSSQTVKSYVGWARRWFVSQGIYIDDILFKQQVKPKRPEMERKFSFEMKDIQNMIAMSNQKHRVFLFIAVATGARQGEILQLKWRDIDWFSTPVMVNFPAQITKTKRERISFLTPESAEIVKDWGTKNPHQDNDFILDIGQSTIQAHMNVMRNRLGLGDRYNTGTHKASLHRLRAYVKKQLSRAVSDDFAHVILGHVEGLQTYDADNLDGMRSDYTKAIPLLTVNNASKIMSMMQRERNRDVEFQKMKEELRRLREKMRD